METKIKVLMLGPARSVNGGISAVVNHYYGAGLDQKIELEYISTMEDGNKWHKLLVALKAYIFFWKKVAKYELIHIHMASDVSIYRKLPFIWFSKVLKKKLILQQHGGNIEQFYYTECGKIRQYLIRKSLQKADVFLVVAPYLKDIFEKILEKNKIVVFPNAIEIPENPCREYKEENILFLGRLCKEKGIYELLEAAEGLKAEFPGLQLYLGGVWVEDALEKKAKSCGEFVHDLGWLDAEQKDFYLRKCNLFVLPTYFEGLPMSLLEGMAYGCACVASEVGGIPQVMTDRENGILIPAKEVQALKDALRQLLQNKKLQRQLGENARRHVAENYEIKQRVTELVHVYTKVKEKGNDI